MSFGRRDFLRGAVVGGAALAASTGLTVDLADWLDVAEPPPPPTAAPITLKDFMRGAWHVVEPAAGFTDGWHIDAIAEHLEAVSRGQIRNLLINMPPRHMKSLCVSVFWPVWSWIFEPHTRWLFSSYAARLSERDALKSRRIIESPWFQKNYGHIFQLVGDQNTKARYENSRTGYRIATSVEGSATGEGGDLLVTDDPHKAVEGSSEKKREKVLEWWDETMSSRLNDQRTGRKVIVMQRLHEGDLSGHVLDKGTYEHLMLPAEYDPKRRTFTAIGWSDPRQHDGELLWPQRVGAPELAALKVELGSYGYAGQYQQAPAPRGGGLFREEWWQYWTTLPRLKSLIIVGDTASKDGAKNDYSVLAVWGEGFDGNFYLLDLWREKVEIGGLLRATHTVYYRHRAAAPVGYMAVIEDKGSGTVVLQTMRRPYYLPDEDATAPAEGGGVRQPAIVIGPFPREKSPREADLARLDKESRAEAVLPLVENRRVFLPLNAPWLKTFLAEHSQFPAGQHDDIVDTTVIALIRLYLTKAKPKPPPARSGGTRTYA